MTASQRKLVTILAADAAGYSRLMGDDEAATVRTVTEYREVFTDHIDRHHGRVVDTAGDSVLAVFESPVEGVACAVEIQKELVRRNRQLAEHRRMPFRIGLNLGDIITRADGTVYGDGVNIAARCQAIADPDGICISANVHEHVEGHLQSTYADLGDQQVKNIAKPVRAYKVLSETSTPARTVAPTPNVPGPLQAMEDDQAPTAAQPVPAVAAPPTRRTSTKIAAAVAAAFIAGVAVLVLWRRQAPPPAQVRKFDLTVEGLGAKPVARAGTSGPGAGVVISPDGRRLVYPADGRLWVRELDQLDAKPLAGAEGGQSPTWSPDSQWVAFAVDRELKKAPVAGGQAVTITPLPAAFVDGSGAAWGADGAITFTAGSGNMMRVSARGGEPEEALALQDEQDYHDATALPDGRGVLFVTHFPGNRYSLEALTSAGRVKIRSFDGVLIRHPAFAPSGHILYQRVSTNPGIWALPVNPGTLAVTGEPFLVGPNGLRPSVAADGTLVYVSDDLFGLVRLSLIDRAGTVVRDIGEPGRGFKDVDLSPSGRRAVLVAAESEKEEDVWAVDVDGGDRTRLTSGSVRGHAAWAPRGDQVYFSCGATSREGGVCAVAADGSREPKVVAPGGSMPNVSADGRWLAYILLSSQTQTDVWARRLDITAEPVLVVQTPAFDYSPAISPDGRFLVYGSSRSGTAEVYVTRFPSGQGTRQVSTASGAQPRWNPRGGELFYVDSRGRLMAVRFGSGDPPSVGAPVELFAESVAALHLSDGYAPTSDGQHFLVIRDVGREKAHVRVAIVQNWFAEFAADRSKP